jgi:hypothetical protein
MARRAARRGGGSWWVVVALVAIALAFWWLRARRVEAPAPPAITTGQPGLQAAPGSAAGGGDADEITQPEKRELDRVLREHSADPAGR